MDPDSHCRSLLVLTLLGVGFLLLPNVVVACALGPKPTVLQAYEKSDVVIIARAISVEKLSDQSQYADDDLLYLNKMDKVRGRTRISGTLDDDGLAGLSLEAQPFLSNPFEAHRVW